MKRIKLINGGFNIEFTKPVPQSQLENIANYNVTSWYYQPNSAYGGDKRDVHNLTVNSAIASIDRRKVKIFIEGLQEGYVIKIQTPNLHSDHGEKLWSDKGWYTLNNKLASTDPSPTPTPTPTTGPGYLNMPPNPTSDFSNVPTLLSQTGAFNDTGNLISADGVIPYDINAPLWTDRAQKQRWLYVPSGSTVTFDPLDTWLFPAGSVLVKQFDLPIDENDRNIIKRMETRLLVAQPDGYFYGVTYKWRADNSDADLLTAALQENITIQGLEGETWLQTWSYPSPGHCMGCHMEGTGFVIGAKTPQLNVDYDYGKVSENQLRHLSDLGLFNVTLSDTDIASYDKFAFIEDSSVSVEHRIRSYLDANCSHCHGSNPNLTKANFDARYSTPLSQQGLIYGSLLGSYGGTEEYVIKPGDIKGSILHLRDSSNEPGLSMPPLGRTLVHDAYINVLEQWILSLL